jgi:hypothetical protein
MGNKRIKRLWKLASKIDHHVRRPEIEDMLENHRKTVPPEVSTFM